MLPKSFGTHDGSFHGDEVTACALLLLSKRVDRDKVIRTRDLNLLATCEYVCDVGGLYDPIRKRFDHHQVNYDGDKSSAGMVWEYLRDEGDFDQKTYDYINQALILGVDAHDTGKISPELGVATFSQIIANFVPVSYEATPEEQNKAFQEALDFTLGHIRRLLQRFHYMESCREKVWQAMQKKERFLIFKEAMPWMDVFFDLGGESHPALFVVMPSGEHWKLRGIPPNLRQRMQVRKPLPQEWAGLMDEELQKASGIQGAIFCHKGRFISVWKTKEDALLALKKLEEKE